MAVDVLAGFLLALVIATVSTPVGVSGAVFLVPVQLSVLGTPSALVTPTNLLYNLIAIPGALYKYAKQGTLWNPLTRLLVVGTAPGVVAGAIIRTQVLSSPEAFQFVIAAVLGPLGLWMLLFEPPAHNPDKAVDSSGLPGSRMVFLLALAVGLVGGIYGIGGGSILAPVLVGLGYRVAHVAPAALTSTFATSLIGLATFLVIGLVGNESFAPEWQTGIALGLGGLAGSYFGASIQPRVPEQRLRHLLGFLACCLAAYYLVSALG